VAPAVVKPAPVVHPAVAPAPPPPQPQVQHAPVLSNTGKPPPGKPACGGPNQPPCPK
jgi:hypothetical protein